MEDVIVLPVPRDVAQPPEGRPYGLLGLVVSTVLILLATVLILLLVAAIAFGIAVAALGFNETLERVAELVSPDGLAEPLARRLLVVATLFQDAALSAAVLLAAVVRGRRGWRDVIGWKRWNVRRGVLLVLGLLVLAMIYNVVASSLVEHAQPQAKNWTPTPTGTPWVVAFAVLATLFAPLTEELLFRGWIYTSLRRSFGIVTGIAVSSLLFAAAHWEKTHLYALAVFPVGLGLAFIRERTGSIKASIVVHGIYNGVASALLFLPK